jgi:hypothetical protein
LSSGNAKSRRFRETLYSKSCLRTGGSMSQKMYYTTIGYCLTFANILLIETRFNIVGIFFGVVAAIAFIKALSIKQEK